ncbi:MAG TPA: type II toxin-antitoxin system VapC family toxin [Blastocatellia bacterium]|nr:type II toxin-antitoxin system VapC family toxin [Blastocatellia bacterium]
MSFTLIDTDILIDMGRGVNEAIDCVQRIEQHSILAISVVTQMELLIGCRNKAELDSLGLFLQRFQIEKLTVPISDTAVGLLQQYRLSHGLLIPDGLIAATALERGAPFITKNQRDFRFITGLNLLAYP